MTRDRPRVVLCANTAWNLANFRGGVIAALVAAGFEVIAAAPPDPSVPRLEALGCRFIAVAMDGKGTSPLRDVALLVRLWLLLVRERPIAFLSYTIKPNVYGSLAAYSLGIGIVNNISGLGASFITVSWVTRIVKLLYRGALRHANCVFFQNADDRALFVTEGLVRSAQTKLLPGSGVDLARFRPLQPRQPDGKIRFLLIARMLWDKGVGEYIEAAELIRKMMPDVCFQLLGPLDVQNPAAISRREVQRWVNDGTIEYLGASEDVRPSIAAADCIVLPSYREGLSRVLLEAAAMAKPLIATDVPGCRDVLDDSVNGFLCKPRDGQDLARVMKDFALLSPARRQEMGRASRQKAESEFDEAFVIDEYLQAVNRLAVAS